MTGGFGEVGGEPDVRCGRHWGGFAGNCRQQSLPLPNELALAIAEIRVTETAELTHDVREPGVKLRAGHTEARPALLFARPSVWRPAQYECHDVPIEVVDSHNVCGAWPRVLRNHGKSLSKAHRRCIR